MDVDVYVFDSNLEVLGILSTVTELVWTEKFFDAGSFEFWCPLTTDSMSLISINNFVWIQKESIGLVEYIDISADQYNQKTLHVKGRLAECLLDFRTIYPAVALSAQVSQVIRDLVLKNLISPEDDSRRIGIITLDPLQEDFGGTISYQQTGGSLLSEISNLCSAYKAGFRMSFDYGTSRLVFKVLQSRDLTLDQAENDPVLIASDLDDILQSEYCYSIMDLKNYAYVAGEDSGTNRKVQTVGDSSGLFRRELFVDARDIQTETGDEPLTDDQYMDMLSERGKTKLENYVATQAYDASVRVSGSQGFVYGKDYTLGDFVTIQDLSIGIQLNSQVTGIETSYDSEGEHRNLAFGNQQPTIADVLKRRGV